MAGGDKKNIWIIANFKSNKNLEETLDWISYVGPKIEKRDYLKVVVCPTFTSLEEAKKAIQVGNYPMLVGSQDLSPFDEGAYTGEEAATILKDIIDLSILGHSERRKNFAETDETVAKKVDQAIESNIIPLVCVQSQDVPVPEKCQLVAYEPIFAIGTDKPDTPQNAETVAKSLKQKYGDNLEILYGGSVSSENCRAFLNEENISGFLIGHKALDPEEFIKIVNNSLGV